MILKEKIEQKKLDENYKIINGYFSKTKLTTYSLLTLLIFDAVLFLYALFVSMQLVFIFSLAVVIFFELILLLWLVPSFNISNRSASFIAYMAIYGLPAVVYIVGAIINFQIFEISLALCRLSLFAILLCDFKVKRINQLLLYINLVFAFSITTFSIGNETLTGLQRYSRRIQYQEKNNSYHVNSIDSGLSDRIIISNSYLGKKVTEVEDKAFKNINSFVPIKRLILPENLEKVSDNAFTSCQKPVKIISNSKKVTFGKSLSKCSTITSLEFPKGVTSDYDFSFLIGTSDFNVYLPLEDINNFTNLGEISKRFVPITDNNEIFINFYDEQGLLESRVAKKNNNKVILAEPDYQAFARVSNNWFLGWYFDKEFTQEVIFPLTLNENLNLYGKYLPTYQITYHVTNDSQYNVPTTYYHKEMANIVLPEPQKRGYSFNGWYDNSDLVGSKITTINALRQENIDLHGEFEIKNYTITYHNTKDALNSNPTTYTIIDIIPLADLAKSGYSFIGWFDGAGEAANRITNVRDSDRNLDIYAHWTMFEYDLYYDLSYENRIEQTKYNTESSNIWTPERFGYTFLGWYDGSNFATANKVTTLLGKTGNLRLYARWEITNYVIEYKNTMDVNVTLPATYTIFDAFSLGELVKPGYEFIRWYEEVDEERVTATQIELNSTGKRIFHAEWEIEEYDITYINVDDIDNPNDFIANRTNVYTVEDEFDTPIITRKAYNFLGWKIVDELENEISSDYVTEIEKGTVGDLILKAYWEEIEFQITYVIYNEGSIHPDYLAALRTALNNNSTYTITNPMIFGVPGQPGYTAGQTGLGGKILSESATLAGAFRGIAFYRPTEALPTLIDNTNGYCDVSTPLPTITVVLVSF